MADENTSDPKPPAKGHYFCHGSCGWKGEYQSLVVVQNRALCPNRCPEGVGFNV